MVTKKAFSSPLLYLTIGYFFTRFLNLLTLPIFNDEAIYIDWGFKELHTQGLLFYSLYDGKPPLLMWVFGIFNKVISDPLLAARTVSVLTGFITLLGIYKITKKYFNKNIATLTSLLYIVIPIFAFFDRQALMESAIGAIGVWSIYLFLNFLEKPILKNSLTLGLVWGVGLFIKQTALVFIVAQIAIYFWLILKTKLYKFNWLFISAFYTMVIVLVPLYLQNDFWATLPGNTRFTLTPAEIISLPILTWFKNTQSISLISFWYLFIPVIIFSLVGIVKAKTNDQKIIISFFLICIGLIILESRTISPRYLVCFLPVVTIFAGYGLSLYNPYPKILKHLVFLITLTLPIFFTYLLITNPLKYFDQLSQFTNYSQQNDYISGWTSGYGVIDAISYIKDTSQDSITTVGVRVDAGNPESSVFAYFEGSKNITPTYFDAEHIDPVIFNQKCLKTNGSFYFVSRDGNQAGMDKFLTLEKIFNKPYGENFISVYKLKECT